MSKVLACADIGSNTVHLLVAKTDGVTVDRIDNRSEWLGLGESIARNKKISNTEINQLIDVLGGFRQCSKDFQADALYLFATEAVRAATNNVELIKRIQADGRMKVHVIPPEIEAAYSLMGASIDTGSIPEMTFVELGGGSAQIAEVSKNHIRKEVSLPLGTGRVTAFANLTNPCPPDRVEAATQYVRDHLRNMPPMEWKKMAVASGGVARGLWRALHPDGERWLALEEIRYLLWASSRLTVETAAARFSCKPKRAATLLPGALVFHEVMKAARIESILVSEFGIREGAILAMYAGEVEKWLN
jgi:exopolyphosphatase/guanosine-5'-triphosphate,3'-diphosphate pyrophosphatase